MPLTPVQASLLLVECNLLFLGTGLYSLWPVEDGLIYKRIGALE